MADMRTKIQDSVTKAFKSFGNIVELTVYNQIKVGVYNADTGMSEKLSKSFKVNAIFTAIHEQQHALIDIVNGDMKVMIASQGITFIPDLQDTLIRNKDEYTVVAVRRDSVDAVFTLQVRLK